MTWDVIGGEMPETGRTHCARAAGDKLVIGEGSFDSGGPIMRLCGADSALYAWFHLSTVLSIAAASTTPR